MRMRFRVFCIRPPGGILVHDGMLGYGSDSGKDPEPLLFRNILHFHKGILIGTVARKVNGAMVSVAALAIKKACLIRKECELYI